MKITSDDLKNHPLGNSDPNADPKKIENPPLYKKGEASVDIQDPIAIYHPQVHEAFRTFKVHPAKSMRDALNIRSQRIRAMTHREVDISMRSTMHDPDCCLNLASDFFWEAFFMHGNFITECNPGYTKNPYELRAQYNRGRAFMKSDKYRWGTPQVREPAEKLMEEIIQSLKELQLPYWSKEQGEQGNEEEAFAIELTKPEFLTFDQYQGARQKLATTKTALEFHRECESYFQDQQSIPLFNT